MILDNINITAYKYQFDSNLPLEERSFFNYTNPPAFVESLNIKDFLLDLGQLQFNFDDTNENNYSLVPSEINFTVASIKTITDFFGLYTNDIYSRFKVEIKYNGLVIWYGVINPESFKQVYKPSPDSYRLSFSAFGLEKEFADYFKTQLLESVDGESEVDPDEFLGINFIKFTDLIKKQFNPDDYSILYETDIDISLFKVALDDVLSNDYQSEYYPITFIKAGFNNIVDLKESKFDWFKKTLTAMGWVFYFSGDTMVIKNRRSTVSGNYNILNDALLEWEYNKQFAESGYNYILIPDSEDIWTGDGLSNTVSGDLSGRVMYGDRGYLFSDVIQNFLETTPFRDWSVLNLPSPATDKYLFVYESGQNVTQYVDEEGNIVVLNALTTNSGTSFNYAGTVTTLIRDRVLKLETGKSQGRLNGVTNKLNENNEYDPEAENISYQLVNKLYKITNINYGNALYQNQDTTPTGKYMTYQDYMRTPQALYNFSSMLQSKSIKRVKARVKGLLLNNKSDNFYFDNTELPNSISFQLNSISYDFINEITTLELEQNI